MMTKQNRGSHIRLTSHPGRGGIATRFPIAWGAASARERGPVVGTVNAGVDRNAIGAHGGSYALYRALAVSSGALSPIARPDLTNTSPVVDVGPFPQEAHRRPRVRCRVVEGRGVRVALRAADAAVVQAQRGHTATGEALRDLAKRPIRVLGRPVPIAVVRAGSGQGDDGGEGPAARGKGQGAREDAGGPGKADIDRGRPRPEDENQQPLSYQKSAPVPPNGVRTSSTRNRASPGEGADRTASTFARSEGSSASERRIKAPVRGSQARATTGGRSGRASHAATVSTAWECHCGGGQQCTSDR